MSPAEPSHRRGLALGVGQKLLDNRARDGLAEQSLDASQLFHFVGRDERDGCSAGTGSTGSADAVNIVLRLVRQLEVDDVWEILDVEAARRHVRGHENLDEASSERLEGAGSLRLAAVAVDRRGADAASVQIRSQPARADLAACEDQNLLHRVPPDQVDQQVGLPGLIDRVQDLGQVVGDAVARRHFDDLGIVLEFLCHTADVVGEGGREE